MSSEETRPLLQTSSGYGTRHLRITISAIALGSFLAAFDLTIIASIYPSIGSDFNALNQTSYIATAYLLANTALQPLYGRLSDIYGRKQALLFANSMFLIGTIACTLAPNLWSLVLARGVAGLGGGGLNVVGVVILSDLVPVRSRGIYQGIMNIVFGSGSALGAPIGGLLADRIGWRWAFGIQLPFCLISILMVYNFVNVAQVKTSTGSMRTKLARIDFLGSGLLVSSVSCWILALNIGGNTQPWSAPTPIVLAVSGSILLLCFVYVEGKYAIEPIMPLSLISRRNPLLTNLTNFFATAAYFVVIFNIPLFYRAVLNLPAAKAGERLIPGAVGGSIGSLGLGLLMAKTGKYKLFMLGSAILLVGCSLLIHSLHTQSALWQQFLYLVPGGFGYGGLLTTTLVALLSSIEPSEMAAATGTSYLFRSSGSIVGISVSASLLNALLFSRLTVYLPEKTVRAIKHDVNAIWKLPSDIRPRVVETYVSCMQTVFVLSIALAFTALIICSGVKENVLAKSSFASDEDEQRTSTEGSAV